MDIREKWPELFAPLTAPQRLAVSNAIASSVLEGYEPQYESTRALIDYFIGNITSEEYDQRCGISKHTVA